VNTSERSPWRFLTPLDGDSAADRALIQLTRHDELRIVTDMATSSKASILYAMSGNGKTSLLDAGLIPAVKSKGWLVVRTRPRPPWSLSDPVRAFKDCILREVRLPLFGARDLALLGEAHAELALLDSAGDTKRVRDILKGIEMKIRRLPTPDEEPRGLRDHLAERLDLRLREFVGELVAGVGQGSRLLIICDQFEELFVHYGNSDAIHDFAEQIGDLWADDALNANLLFSMREDWVGSMIEVRRAIPPIFTNYFKLDPLRRAAGANVLTEPLKGTEYRFAGEAVEAILTDLARAYLETRLPDTRPSPSLAAADEAFVELPALHIVAERMWQTRRQHDPPFTMAHYQGLMPDAVAPVVDGAPRTPAAFVLDDYLTQQLDLDGEGPLRERFSAGEFRDLCLDCLVLLTDEVAHRRALSEQALVSQVRRLRPADLSLPEVDAAAVQGTLAPLSTRRIVRTLDGTPEEGGVPVHYELSHDFAVRAVIRAWRQLEQRRIGALALRRREQEARAHQVAIFQATEHRIGRFLQAVPLLVISVWLVLSVGQFPLMTRIGIAMNALPIFGGLVGLLAVGGLVAALARDRESLFATLALILIFGASLWFVHSTMPWEDWYWVGGRGALMLGVGIFAGFVGLSAVRRIERRLGAGAGRDHVWAVAQAEWVDGMAWMTVVFTALVVGVISAQAVRYSISFAQGVVGWGAGLSIIVLTFLLSAWQVVAWGSTPGYALAGLRLRRADGVGSPDWPRALQRQLLFMAWTVPNIMSVGVASLLAGALGAARFRERAWYDVLSQVKVVADVPWLIRWWQSIVEKPAAGDDGAPPRRARA
jgi:hypothetical protein